MLVEFSPWPINLHFSLLIAESNICSSIHWLNCMLNVHTLMCTRTYRHSSTVFSVPMSLLKFIWKHSFQLNYLHKYYSHYKEETLGLRILLLLFPNVVCPTITCWRTKGRKINWMSKWRQTLLFMTRHTVFCHTYHDRPLYLLSDMLDFPQWNLQISAMLSTDVQKNVGPSNLT